MAVAICLSLIAAGFAVYFMLQRKKAKKKVATNLQNISTSNLGNTPNDTSSARASDFHQGSISRQRSTCVMYDDLDIMKPALSEGNFGKVSKAVYNGVDIAIKTLKSSASIISVADFDKEIDILSFIPPHPQVVKILGVTSEPKGILMELYPLLSIEEYLIKQPNLTETSCLNFQKVLQITIDASASLIHIHKSGVVHCDVAARNFLLKVGAEGFSASIADFGLSLVLPDGMSVGTRTEEEHKADQLPVNITAPERLKEGKYSPASDVYMFGLFLWELFQRQSPHVDNQLLIECLKNKDLLPWKKAICQENLRPEFGSDWPFALKNIVKGCWSKRPAERFSMGQVNKMLRDLKEEVCAQNIPLPKPATDVSSESAAALQFYNDELYNCHSYQS